MKITDNRFGAGRYGTSCPMRLPKTSPISLTGNVWDSNFQVAKAVRF